MMNAMLAVTLKTLLSQIMRSVTDSFMEVAAVLQGNAAALE